MFRFASRINYSTAIKTNDLYNILNLSRSCSKKDIKHQYYKLSKQFHPDQCTDANAKENFIKISLAYEILGDEKKKKLYDENLISHKTNYVYKPDFKTSHDSHFYKSDFNFNSSPEEFYSNQMENEKKFTGNSDNQEIRILSWCLGISSALLILKFWLRDSVLSSRQQQIKRMKHI
ncbi:hypothetical protein HK099_005910 [Clydaea vesicula]|uniref:J domain-containing protein n=1 Tax=Clydaea vesicula TaxID=447962 RepID=A0AAD5XXA3_9FUNG|nr:hypothetical protein HK099_005910 [Clydaea vesicula]KAJ3393777.1 hypothetical protein HDU92_007522 [Lobulomyces angularis]